jgi:hypothetical protein
MKQKILLLLLLAVGLGAFGQSGVRVYGYVRDVLPGTVRRGLDENGKPLPRTDVQSDYLIYLSGPAALKPLSIWINGKPFRFTVEKIGKGPVEEPGPGARKKRILVGKTSGSLQRITPLEGMADTHVKGKTNQLKSNELVVVYEWRGKTYSLSLKKMVRLEPVHNE